MFTREQLQITREHAKEMASCSGLNPDWQRAYLQLASAADYLDAMIARTTHKSEKEIELNKP